MVQRRGWRAFATRLNGDGTETMLHPSLPVSDLMIEQVLSGDGSISGSLDPTGIDRLALCPGSMRD